MYGRGLRDVHDATVGIEHEDEAVQRQHHMCRQIEMPELTELISVRYSWKNVTQCQEAACQTDHRSLKHDHRNYGNLPVGFRENGLFYFSIRDLVQLHGDGVRQRQKSSEHVQFGVFVFSTTARRVFAPGGNAVHYS